MEKRNSLGRNPIAGSQRGGHPPIPTPEKGEGGGEKKKKKKVPLLCTNGERRRIASIYALEGKAWGKAFRLERGEGKAVTSRNEEKKKGGGSTY